MKKSSNSLPFPTVPTRSQPARGRVTHGAIEGVCAHGWNGQLVEGIGTGHGTWPWDTGEGSIVLLAVAGCKRIEP